MRYMYILCGDMNIRPLVWYILSIHCAARRASHVSTAEGSKFVGPESTKNVATIQGTPKVHCFPVIRSRLCIRVRFCLGPALVSLRFSFHLADGLALFCLYFGFCFVWFALSTRSSPSVAVVFESIARLPFSLWGAFSLPRSSTS